MAAVTIRRAALPHRIRACRHAPHLRDSADAPSLRRTSATPSGSLSGASLHPRRNACRRASAATTPAAAASPHPRSPLSTRAVSTPTHLPGPPGGDPQISRMESFPASSLSSRTLRPATVQAAGRHDQQRYEASKRRRSWTASVHRHGYDALSAERCRLR